MHKYIYNKLFIYIYIIYATYRNRWERGKRYLCKRVAVSSSVIKPFLGSLAFSSIALITVNSVSHNMKYGKANGNLWRTKPYWALGKTLNPGKGFRRGGERERMRGGGTAEEAAERWRAEGRRGRSFRRGLRRNGLSADFYHALSTLVRTQLLLPLTGNYPQLYT